MIDFILNIISKTLLLILLLLIMFWLGFLYRIESGQTIYNKGVHDGKKYQLQKDKSLMKECETY